MMAQTPEGSLSATCAQLPHPSQPGEATVSMFLWLGMGKAETEGHGEGRDGEGRQVGKQRQRRDGERGGGGSGTTLMGEEWKEQTGESRSGLGLEVRTPSSVAL